MGGSYLSPFGYFIALAVVSWLRDTMERLPNVARLPLRDGYADQSIIVFVLFRGSVSWHPTGVCSKDAQTPGNSRISLG